MLFYMFSSWSLEFLLLLGLQFTWNYCLWWEVGVKDFSSPYRYQDVSALCAEKTIVLIRLPPRDFVKHPMTP
jgi:hypothetical protein